MNKKYYPEIDVCKGLGIILVVFGHALKQTGDTNTVFQILLSFIYSFHMPLFFMVSGFVSKKILEFTANGERMKYIKSRAVRLLVPYFAVGLFYMPIKFVLSRFAVKPYDFSNAWKILIGENPNTVLWFLYTLFWVSVVSTFVIKKQNLNHMMIICGVVSLTAYLVQSPVEFPKYWFFFVAGMYLRINYEQIISRLRGKNLALVTTVFAIANVILYVTGNYVFTFFTAISGCLCSLAAARTIVQKEGIIYKITEMCGKYSMDIYILSDLIATAFRILVWGILNMNYLVCALVCFIAGMFLPIPVSKYIIQKVKIFKLLVLGIK